METSCKRVVVLHANDGPKHLNVGLHGGQSPITARSRNTSESHDLEQSRTTQHSHSESHPTGRQQTVVTPPTVHRLPVEACHSPSLHLTGSRDALSSSSSSLPLSHSTAHKHTATGQCQGQNTSGKVRKRKWRKGRKVHPVSHNDTGTHPPPHRQHTTPYQSPSTAAGSLQSSCSPTPSLPVLPPTSDLSCSLPPLLSCQLRKGGRTVSVSVNWSSDGGAELERCVPGRQLRVYVGTWNMQQLSVSGSLTLSSSISAHSTLSGSA